MRFSYNDTDYFYSISMSIMQIGELSSSLSDDFKEKTRSHMPWGLIKAMRNRFAHAYSIMGKDDIWETATQDIPTLLTFCNSIIDQDISVV